MNNDEAQQSLLKALINYEELLWTDDASVLYYLSVFCFTFIFLGISDEFRQISGLHIYVYHSGN